VGTDRAPICRYRLTIDPVPGRRHLLIYEFGPSANIEGRLVGALERMEAAGEASVLDGLFVANDIDTGELVAIDLRSGSARGGVARLLTFRLDAGARRHATAKTLSDSGSVSADVVRDLGGALKPGCATLALLIEGPEQEDLRDAVARTGGRTLSAEPVRSSSLAELAPELLAAVSSHHRS
jgi:hypothetical protein